MLRVAGLMLLGCVLSSAITTDQVTELIQSFGDTSTFMARLESMVGRPDNQLGRSSKNRTMSSGRMNFEAFHMICRYCRSRQIRSCIIRHCNDRHEETNGASRRTFGPRRTRLSGSGRSGDSMRTMLSGRRMSGRRRTGDSMRTRSERRIRRLEKR